MAGLDAGLVYNTYPKFADRWLPTDLLAMTPKWKNMTENTTTVQFNHRHLVSTYTVQLASTATQYGVTLTCNICLFVGGVDGRPRSCAGCNFSQSSAPSSRSTCCKLFGYHGSRAGQLLLLLIEQIIYVDVYMMVYFRLDWASSLSCHKFTFTPQPRIKLARSLFSPLLSGSPTNCDESPSETTLQRPSPTFRVLELQKHCNR